MRRLGSYELVEPLGRGGMGEVWLARHAMLGRPAAIKLIPFDRLADRGSDRATNLRRMFEREALATSRLSSPHTVQLYDFGLTDDGSFYYAMELLTGVTLEALVARHGPLEQERAIFLVRQVCESLAEAHQGGLVHRDIKPANVFSCQLGLQFDFVKVVDFGLVELTAETRPDRARQGGLGLAVGSPAFIPPEVVDGSVTLDARADLYSLGCVLYWLLTGQLVFEAETLGEMVAAHAHELPIPPSQRTEIAIAPELERIVMACLAKTPADRPRTAGELARLLAGCPVDTVWTEERAERWWRDHYPEIVLKHSPLTQSPCADDERLPPPQERVAQPAIADRASLVVLPFESVGGDPDGTYFSEGVSEDILVELSKFEKLFVISRPSAFAHKGRAVDARQIAQEFGVRYVVTGNVREVRKRVRLSVQLIDGPGECQVWANLYDCEIDEIFDVQDDIVRTIVAKVVGRGDAEKLERARRRKPAMIEAYDLVLRGKELHRLNRSDAADQALDLFERAIGLDPDYALAYCWYVYTATRSTRWHGDDRIQFRAKSRSYLEKAYQLDANESECHRLLCSMAMRRRDFDKARYHQARGIELNPNDERIVCQQGALLAALGRGNEAEEWIRRAMRLNPYHPNRWWSHLGRALHLEGKYARALQAFRRVREPQVLELAFMAACSEGLGDLAAARSHAVALLELDPSFRSTAFAASLSYENDSILEPLLGALCRAGLPV